MKNKYIAKTLKKLTAFVCSLVLVLSCAACGKNENTGEPDSGYDQESLPQESEDISASIGSDSGENKTESDNADYERAFLKEYVPAEYADRVLEEQISSVEYKALLEQLIACFDEAQLSYFQEKVSDYDTPLLRGQAVTMSYYAAVCIGADNYNNSFDHSDADGGDFWGTEGEHFETLFPQCFGEPVVVGTQEWQNEYVASYLWNIWHSSPYSGFQTIAFDPMAMSMRNHDPFTVEDAVCAITRLYDSAPTKAVFISIDDPEAKSPDADVLTQDLMDKAAASQIVTIEDLPRLTGFVLSNSSGYGTTTISTFPSDIERIAEWGFTSARIMLTYETLFSEDANFVNIAELSKLDDLVAAAIENNLHLNLLLCTLPGRTTWYDDGFVSGGDFDLFVNKSKQEDASRIWKLLAERYSDIPGEYLSFTPFWEATNGNLSTNGKAPDYTTFDVCDTLDMLIGSIREADPDRFIIYEVTARNGIEETIRESTEAYETIPVRHDNVRISFNFCEIAFVYAEMTVAEGASIDFNNHSMFKPEYPVTIYAAMSHIKKGSDLTIDGFLPKGTVIEIYLRSMGGSGSFTVISSEETLYQESIRDASFQTGDLLSGLYPFATSDKLITVTLDGDSEAVNLACSGGWVDLCGINVILPEQYAVDRWYMRSSYDAYLSGEQSGFFLEKTSTVMICPNSYDVGSHITIQEDISYISEVINDQSNAETIDAWGSAISNFAPSCLIRFERGGFSLGTTSASLLRYYEDVLSMMDRYSFDWYSNDYYDILSGGGLADANTVEYGAYRNFNMELLELLQKHQ